MEMVGLVLVLVLVLWYVGALKAITSVTKVGVREAESFNAIHKAKAIKMFAEMNEIDDASLEKAQKNKAKLDGFDF